MAFSEHEMYEQAERLALKDLRGLYISQYMKLFDTWLAQLRREAMEREGKPL